MGHTFSRDVTEENRDFLESVRNSMRKINMKRKSRKEKVDQHKSDDENGVEEKSSDPKTSSEEEDDDFNPEPESKKKSEKRKSGSFSNKKAAKKEEDDSADNEEEDDDFKPEPESKKKKSEKRKSGSLSNKKAAKKESEEEDEDSADNEEEDDDFNAEPKSKKKKSEKRKSVSFSNKKAVKKESEEEDDNAEYEVEEVLDEKMVKGVRHYLIRWKGYEPESDSWEPESTLDCVELIKKFKAGREDKGSNENADSKKSKKNIKKEKKPKGKKTPKTEPKVDWESDDEFEVDRIIDVYFKRNGKREFLVSWKGYPSSQDSWEPEENLDCKDLISKFMAKVDAAKEVGQKELRVHRHPTERFTLSMYSGDATRRLSRRNKGKQRVQYHDAE